jgi:hypothetical protein
MQSNASSRLYQLLLTLAIAVNFSGIFMTIIGPDGALYASIAKTMVMKNNYLELFGNGTDLISRSGSRLYFSKYSGSTNGVINFPPLFSCCSAPGIHGCLQENSVMKPSLPGVY